jgi:hypothetical protein
LVDQFLLAGIPLDVFFDQQPGKPVGTDPGWLSLSA